MSKQDSSDSYFKKTFGGANAAKPAKDAADEPKSRKKEFSKDGDKPSGFKKSGPSEGKRPFKQKDRDEAPRSSYGPKKEGAAGRKFEDKEAPRRSFDRKEDAGFERKPRFEKDGERKPRFEKDGERKPRRDDAGGSYERKPRFDKEGGRGEFKPRRDDAGAERKPRFDKEDGKRDFKPRRDDAGAERKPRFEKEDRGERKPRRDEGDRPRRNFEDKKSLDSKGPKREQFEAPQLDENGEPVKRPRKPKSDEPDLSNFKAPKGIVGKEFPKKVGHGKKPGTKKAAEEEEDMEDGLLPAPPQPEQMPLNKYIAHCGLSSRRDAVEYIKQGKVRVNGELITEPGYKVRPEDTVVVAGKKILPQRNLAYILLNKPKGFITTTEDEKDRDTVMQLVAASGVERLFPVGRLDRNTTGLLLLTNDGDLAQKLAHPKYMVRKVYQVTLDRSLATPDFQKIMSGTLTLEDGEVQVDALAYLDARNELGIEIHSGRNRVVRRIFESLGYTVEKLDRVMYAGLTKKNLPRGKWRMLTEHEVILLKHFKSNK